MPRRKPKSAWKEGQSGNPNGRPIGSTNQINNEIRDAFAMLLQSQIPNLQDWLNRAAAKDPIKALDLFTRISERFVPSLQRTEHHIEGGFQMPINILMPNPTIHLGSQEQRLEIGEGASTKGALTNNLVGSEDKGELEIGEGAPSTNVNGVFSLTIPEFAPTERMLRETGEYPQESSGDTLTNP